PTSFESWPRRITAMHQQSPRSSISQSSRYTRIFLGEWGSSGTRLTRASGQVFCRCSPQPGRPLPDDASHLDEHILLALAGAFERAEAMVCSVEEVECRALAEFFADRLQKVQIRQLVARAAEEEHRDRDRAEVVRALRVGAAGLMQGGGEESAD